MERISLFGPSEPIAQQAQPRRFFTYGFAALVVIVASIQAGFLYAHFRAAPQQLWVDVIHDRNAHYWLGLNFALDFRHADLSHFMHDLHSARSWPPLHALLVGIVLAVGGIDYRLAVLPSLIGWIGTALFAFLGARRAVKKGGATAGLIAAVFVLASPAYRAFATDIMLESLGACLSLAALYCYLVAVQERSARAGRWLGLTLTALFFEKYNYWLLVMFGLGAAEIVARPGAVFHVTRTTLAAVAWRSWLRAQLRHPLTYPLVLVGGLLFALALTGGGTITIGHRAIHVRSPYNLVSVAYVLLLLRLAPWWYRLGRIKIDQVGAAGRAAVNWHGVPVLLWWLWPQRLGYCLWYVSPVNAGERPQHDLLGGAPYYVNCLAHDYHLGMWSLLVAGALAVIGLLAWHRMRAGGLALVCFLLIAAALTCVHPNRKSRFLHSWLAAGWIVAGIGVTQLLGRRQLLTTVAASGLALVHSPGFLTTGHAPEGGPRANGLSMLPVTECYLDSLARSRRVAILSNMPVKFWTGWTFLMRYGRPSLLVSDVPGFDPSAPDNALALRRWLERIGCDHLVFVQVRATSPLFQRVPYIDYSEVPALMAWQSELPRRHTWELDRLGCSVTSWERAPAQAAISQR